MEKNLTDTARAKKALVQPLLFEEARLEYEDLIFAFVSRRIRPIEEAEDIVAHVFVDAYIQWKRLRGNPRNWLLGIARRKVCDALRKQRKQWSVKEDDSQTCGLGAFMVANEAREAIAIVMLLPDDQRDAILLQVLEELPIDQIAEIMQRSPASVNSLLQRARTRIQRTLESHNREGVSQ